MKEQEDGEKDRKKREKKDKRKRKMDRKKRWKDVKQQRERDWIGKRGRRIEKGRRTGQGNTINHTYIRRYIKN